MHKLYVETFNPQSNDHILMLDKFLSKSGGVASIDVTRDQVCMLIKQWDDPNKPTEVVGCFAARPMVMVHEFRIDNDNTIPHVAAEGLWNYAKGAAHAAGHTECLFVVDKSNSRMLRFVQSRNAIEGSNDNDRVFVLQIK